MKNLSLTFVIIFLSLMAVAQEAEQKFYVNLVDSSSWKTVKAFYNEHQTKEKPEKQPEYHQLKIIGGIIFASSGTTDFSNGEKPFILNHNLMPNICLVTNCTYHNFTYGFNNNTIKIVNGYKFGKNDLDVYVTPGINLNSGVVSIATGIEKKIKVKEELNFFLFAELGKDIKFNSKLNLSIGFHVNIQNVF